MNLPYYEVRFFNPNGISLEIADRLAELAQTFRSCITISCDGVEANLKSLQPAKAHPKCCVSLAITAHGHDAQAAIAALANLILAADSGTPAEDRRGEVDTPGTQTLQRPPGGVPGAG